MPKPHITSIKNKLILSLISVTLVVWLLSAISIYFIVYHEADELFDDALIQIADTVLVLGSKNASKTYPSHFKIKSHTKEDEHELADDEKEYIFALDRNLNQKNNSRILIQIWNENGKVLYQTQGIQSLGLTNPTANNKLGLQWLHTSKQKIRVYSQWNNEHKIQIQVAEKRNLRSYIQKESSLHLATVVLLFLPILVFFIIYIVKAVLKPLQTLTVQIQHRHPNDLTTIDTANYPTELHAVINALNGLLKQVDSFINKEKQFTANAAHELRTPLAALRMHSQVLQRARNANESNEAISDIQHAVDRASHLIEQLMTLAKIEHSAQIIKHTMNLDVLINDYIKTLNQQKIALKHTLELNLTPCTIQGVSTHIEILLKNLIENAANYSPLNSVIHIRCGYNAQQKVFLQISDNGMGINTPEKNQIFNRFYRAPTANQVSKGSGLGLAIVKEIVNEHNADITLTDNKPCGSVFTVTFVANV